MVIGVPIPRTYSQCRFLNRFKSVNLALFDEETRQWPHTLVQV